MRKQNNQLGIDPVTLTLLSSAIPALLKDRYAETNAMLEQVSQLNANNTTSAAQLQQVTQQIEGAYSQTLTSIKDKYNTLKAMPSGDNDSRTIKVASGIAIASLIGVLVVKKFM